MGVCGGCRDKFPWSLPPAPAGRGQGGRACWEEGPRALGPGGSRVGLAPLAWREEPVLALGRPRVLTLRRQCLPGVPRRKAEAVLGQDVLPSGPQGRPWAGLGAEGALAIGTFLVLAS